MSKNNEVVFDYSTRMPFDSRTKIKIKIPVIFRDDTRLIGKTVKRNIEFLVDTGASHTVIPSYLLDLKDKDRFKKSYGLSEGMIATGVVDSIGVEFFPLWLKSIDLSGISINNPIISVSFDPGMKTALLGMDILGLFNIFIDTERRLLKLIETDKLHEINSKMESVNEPSLIDPRVKHNISKLDIEANYIRKLTEG